jgi:ribosomal protein S18 acetylase RimI-like enzyme
MGSGVDTSPWDTVRWDGGRLRVGPWRGDQSVAYVAPLGEGPPPSAEAVRRACAAMLERGYREVVTAALGPVEARGFLAAGFEVHERLHLLARDLHDLPAMPPVALRRGRRTDRTAVLSVDGRAFDRFWRLDQAGLDEALSATPTSRFRVADAPSDGVAGYAVTGRAGRRGFVQRLAVDPDFQGAGRGTALVLDGLAWLRRRNVERVVVNTQEANAAALGLYERLGFRRQHEGLAVLKTRL